VPEKDMLIWGAGNPKPDYDTDARKGDNLYSNSALALEGATGKLLWYFQFTPADDKDWDSNQIPVLADLPGQYGREPRVLWANRNGFYYVLDRDTGRYLHSAPMVQQTWTSGIDENGRPKPPAEPIRRPEGFVVYPGNVGGTNWWSPAYDAERGLFFAPVIEQGMVFFSSQKSWPRPNDKPFYTAVRALNAATGERVWEHRREERLEGSEIGGLLATQTGLLFGGDLNTFFALDADNGQLLWSVETGGRIGAAPITYAVDGEQYLFIAAGRDLLAFALPKSGS
jgi:alcohol dehydrogenase (cytochrome c)